MQKLRSVLLFSIGIALTGCIVTGSAQNPIAENERGASDFSPTSTVTPMPVPTEPFPEEKEELYGRCCVKKYQMAGSSCPDGEPGCWWFSWTECVKDEEGISPSECTSWDDGLIGGVCGACTAGSTAQFCAPCLPEGRDPNEWIEQWSKQWLINQGLQP